MSGKPDKDSMQFDKRNFFFRDIPEKVRKQMQLDSEALFSVTEQRSADDMSKKLLALPDIDANSTVTDANACIGGNTMSFAKHFKEVNAIEINKERFAMLQHNSGLLNLDNIVFHNKDFVDILTKACMHEKGLEKSNDFPTQDIMFFDPPWGGPDYIKKDKVSLFLSDVDITDVCKKAANFTKYIALKVPLNFALKDFKKELRKPPLFLSVKTHKYKKWLMLVVDCRKVFDVAQRKRSKTEVEVEEESESEEETKEELIGDESTDNSAYDDSKKNWRTPVENNEALSNLLFYQYLIKTHSPDKPNEDLSPSLKKAYETYKSVLSEVIEEVRNTKESREEEEKSMKKRDALEQLGYIQQDTLLLKKSMLIHSSRDIGIESLSRQIVSLQKQILKKMEQIPSSTRNYILHGAGSKKKKNKNDKKKKEKKKEVDKDDETDDDVELEDPVEETVIEEIDFSGDFMVESDEDEALANEEPPEEKIISLTGPLPKSFEILNTSDPQTSNNPSSNSDESIYPIEYFHKSKDYGWLSSFNHAPFLYNGNEYPSIEHAFNAQKSADDEYQKMFVIGSDSFIGTDALKARTAGCDKSFQQSPYQKKADWDSARVSVMKDCTTECLKQHPEIKEKLRATGNHPLHHTGFKVGTFWGMQKGDGCNKHGEILMEIRAAPEE